MEEITVVQLDKKMKGYFFSNEYIAHELEGNIYCHRCHRSFQSKKEFSDHFFEVHEIDEDEDEDE